MATFEVTWTHLVISSPNSVRYNVSKSFDEHVERIAYGGAGQAKDMAPSSYAAWGFETAGAASNRSASAEVSGLAKWNPWP